MVESGGEDKASVRAPAVFISYASQDAAAAARICSTLRQAGVEVWFDQSELRGGDAWDRRIRQQIRDCALFIPVISARTQARAEGYFRLEWHLAEQRTHLIGRQRAFLVPVCIDDTAERDADVPDAFLTVQWTRLPDGALTAPFVGVVRRLLAPQPVPSGTVSAATEPAAAGPVARAPPSGQPLPAPGPPPQPPVRTGSGHSRATRWMLACALVLMVVAVSVIVPAWQRREQARNVLLPAIEETLAKSSSSDAQLFDKALEAEKALPNDRALAKLWPLIAVPLTIETQPAGAGVYWKDYGTPEAPWHFAGATPLKNARVPRNLLRVEVRKQGFETIELVSPRPWNRASDDVPRLALDRAGSLPPGMVRIPASVNEMQLHGLMNYGGVEVPEFLADRYEVTNRQYKAFIDAGGYTNASYWRLPIIEGAKEIPLSAARARFTDRTGRPGPATWEAGTFPDGLADHPVAGVSWYEAAAFAAWAGKELPGLRFHCHCVSSTVSESNREGKCAVRANREIISSVVLQYQAPGRESCDRAADCVHSANATTAATTRGESHH